MIEEMNDIIAAVEDGSRRWTPADLLGGFVDSAGAAHLLGRTKSTVCDMADRGVLIRYAVGTAVLYWKPEVLNLATALRRVEATR